MKISKPKIIIYAYILIAFFIGLSASYAESAGLEVFSNKEDKLKIVIPVNASDAEKDASEELKRFLDEASGASFEIIPEDKTNNGLFVGHTKLASQWGLVEKNRSQDESFAIQVDSATKQIAIVGQSDMATKFAVYDFLSRFVGVRWFLPGELFQVVPKHNDLIIRNCKIKESPALSGRVFAYSVEGFLYPDNHDPQFGSPFVDYSDPRGYRVDTSRHYSYASRWACRNLLSVDGRLSGNFHGHNFIRILPPPIYFKKHPEYYPPSYRIKGATPPHPSYGWMPCLTNPDVLQITLEWGRNFFKNNPESWAWFSLGINDSASWCNCDMCKAAGGSKGQFRGHPIMTDYYLNFVRKVAEEMLEEFPDRKIGFLAYNSIVAPPTSDEKLPPNINVIITRDSFQYHDPDYLAEDIKDDKRWLEVANGNLYRYDYYGLGWMVPRYWPHRMAEDVRRMRDMGIKGIFTEDTPLWPAIGPLYYVATKLWWNPDVDVDKLINDFNTTLFGPAAGPMSKIWERHEQVWNKKRPGKWFEGLGDMERQASMYSLKDIDYLDQQFKEAHKLAGTDKLVQKRIDFFEQGWRLAEYYIREYYLSKQLLEAKSSADIAEWAKKLLESVQARKTFWAEYRKEPRFPGQSKPCEGYRFIIEALKAYDTCEQSLQSVFAQIGNRLVSESPETLEELLSYFKDNKAPETFINALSGAKLLASAKDKPNLVKNPEFKPGNGNKQLKAIAEDWVTEGAPQDWAQWKHISGTFSFDNGIARIHGTNSGCWIQTFPVSPGEEIIGSVQYRLLAKAPAHATLSVIWKDSTGAWLGDYKTVGFNAQSLMPTSKWMEAFCYHVVPRGAATAVFQLGAADMQPGEMVEFKDPHFCKLGTSSAP